MRTSRFIHTVAAALIPVILALGFTADVAAKSLSLQKPVAEGTSFLEEEAGISAYTNIGQAIELAKVKGAFRTVERETDEYIVGSIPLPDYAETEDVHAYVHREGWIVTYYLKEEPAAKIVDWNNYGEDEKIKGTKLEVGITIIFSAAELPMKEVKYYDFRHPDANKLMIVADAQFNDGTNTFDIKLPSDCVFYERSFSHYAYYTHESTMRIDGEQISSIGSYPDYYTDYSVTRYGKISPIQLSLDEFHTVSLYHNTTPPGQAFCAIVLIYQER